MMLLMRLLCCIVYTILCTIHPASSADPVLDPQCYDNCTCCKDELCGNGTVLANTCFKGCISGHRGARCYELCQYENCKSCGGISYEKDCEECKDGYYLGAKKDCTSKCPSNCKSCTSDTECTECKEGFYDENDSIACKFAYCPAKCECNTGQGDCISCKTGFYGTSTLCNKQCPVNCLLCKSEKSCIECKNGFHNGYEYDNNINLQLNNCSYACRCTCTQCQSYNNCLQCIEGKYGQTCQEDCSVGCKDRSCLFDTGHCECTVGFTGDKCMECVVGKYGLFCNKTCAKYCKENICKRTSGECINGCMNENLTGDTCNTCIVGLYGEQCSIICSKKCKYSKCERYSGNCSEGCIRNFNGTMCDLCIHGKYGESCELDCPVNCAGKICEKTSGSCHKCIGNFKGEKCDECKSGYYMPNCEPCSQYCFNKNCDRITGECIYGCTNGYSGNKCCLMGEHCLECTNNTVCRKCQQGFFKTACNVRCPEDCLGSCDISTGECSDCQYNRFGQFCEFNCSHSCKFEEGNHERVCTRSNGTCINGCNDGYFGRTCNKTCGRFCIGGTCRQDDGVCINGCANQRDEPDCLLREQQADEDGGGKTPTIAILGTLFTVSVIIIIMQGLFILVQKRREVALREASRPPPDVAYENLLMSAAPHFSPNNETNVVSANNAPAYEDNNRVEEADEDYQKISTIQSTPEVQDKY